jgi:hypothetical protein
MSLSNHFHFEEQLTQQYPTGGRESRANAALIRDRELTSLMGKGNDFAIVA